MNKIIFALIIVALGGFAIYKAFDKKEEKISSSKKVAIQQQQDEQKKPEKKIAIFAGGCFWCTESSFEKVKGVSQVISGYIGGKKETAFYQAVSSGKTQHIEAIQVFYDPNIVSYKKLLTTFWHLIDPTDAEGSFHDKGYQYTSVIYYLDDEQKQLAEQSKKRISDAGWFKEPIVTSIREATPFYVAEDYHQDYYKKEPLRYRQYRIYSGRDYFYVQNWKDRPPIFPEEETCSNCK